MCGICGEISFGGPADVEAVHVMNGRMISRGPDAGGLFSQNNIALGHRRLSILDLTPTGQQPMIDSELGLAVVFNGCIYNFRQLRDELAGMGYRFFSTGDCEVILKAYHAWGPDCVQRFHGMFAFAIWERDSGRLMLARDRLGIKPIYLAEGPKRLRFASSLPALLEAGGVDTSVDPVALHHYMSYHAVVPAPMTILKGIRKLAAATILMIEPDGTRKESVYWTMKVGPREEDSQLTEEDWKQAVRESLDIAVERRLVADVPVGVLLSGGLDSSLLVGLLAERGQTGLKTFSIGFDAVNGIEGDEFKYSDIIARHFGTEHTRIMVDASRTLEALPHAVRAMSEPMMSHDSVAFYLLSEEVAKHVKVVQSGQGADEIFAGYHWYPKMMRSVDPVSDYAAIYFDRDHEEMTRTLDPRQLSGDYSYDFVEQFVNKLGNTSSIDKILQLDTDIMLVDDPVKRVDNMTMGHGLEARVPFLDHETVELAARVPAHLKVRDGGKWVLKEASRKVIPPEVIDRPKGYFPVPALKHIRGPYHDFVRNILDQPAARKRGIFNRDYVDHLLADPDGTLTPKGHSKLWQVSLLEYWFQSHGI